MILSYRHRFLLIRPMKVGGTSVEIALSTLCGPDDIISPLIPVAERARQLWGGGSRNYGASSLAEQAYAKLVVSAPPETLARIGPPRGRFTAHMCVAEVEQALGRAIDDFTLVTIARDPFAQVISYLHMRGNLRQFQIGTASDLSAPVGALADSLDRCIKRGELGDLRCFAMYDGRQPRVLRYETIAADFAAFVRDLGVAPIALPHAMAGPQSNALDPLALFRPDQIAWLNAYFAPELAAFGYLAR